MRGRITLLVATVVAATVIGCHDLTNPVDPRSTTFTGNGTYRDPPPTEPILPPIARWDVVVEHAAGQYLRLEITDDGKFVEPRQPMDFAEIAIVITFTEDIPMEELDPPPGEGSRQDPLLFVRVHDTENPGVIRTLFASVFFGPNVEIDTLRRQIRLRIGPPEPPFFGSGNGGAMVRVRLVDPTGVIMGERLFGILPGDFNGNGVVTVADDWTGGVLLYDGVLPDGSRPDTVRADISGDGSVAVGSDDEWIVQSQEVAGAVLPSAPPPF